MIYFFVYRYKVYHGPKSNLSPEDEIISEHESINDVHVQPLPKNLENFSAA